VARYLRLLLIFLLLQGCVLAVLTVLNTSFDDTYLAAVADKSNLLESAPSPRVVLVGDSSLAFGMDSSLLRSGLGGKYNPVNMGLHGGLGLSFELKQALAGVRSGDVVVLSPAYETVFADTTELPTVWSALRVQPGAWSYLTSRQRFSLLERLVPDNEPLILSHDMSVIIYNKVRAETTDKLRAALHRAVGRGGPVAGADATSPYARAGFNEYGDQTRAWEAQSLYTTPVGKWELNQEALAKSIATLRDFIAQCGSKNVTVVYWYPPIPKDWYQQVQDVVDQIASALESQLPITFINDAVDGVRPPSDFFDNIHHLRGPAVKERTNELVRDLLPYLP
jgi:hypothetical protein